MVIVDTDVLIFYLRGNPKAKRFVEERVADGIKLSVITYMELVQGMRNKKELTSLRRTLRDWSVEVLYLSEEISAKAMFLVEQHFLSHSLGLADALIGATAMAHALPLATANLRHSRVLDLEVQKFVP